MKAAGLFLLALFFGYRLMACEQGLESFRQNIYPMLRSSCVQCHDSGGDGPAHSSSDLRVAYSIALESANFTNINASTFMKKVRSQHWKAHDSNAQGTTEEIMRESLRSWWDKGEFLCQIKPAFVSQELAIPNDLPRREENKFSRLIWDLGKKDPQFSGCKFEIQAQIFVKLQGVPTSIRVKAPKIGCSGKSIKGSGLRILWGDRTEIFENIYSSVNFDVPTKQNQQISDELMILVEKENVNPSFSLQFESLGVQ